MTNRLLNNINWIINISRINNRNSLMMIKILVIH